MDASDFNPQPGQLYIVAQHYSDAVDKAHAIVQKVGVDDKQRAISRFSAAFSRHDDGHSLSWFHLTSDQTDLADRARAAGAYVIDV